MLLQVSREIKIMMPGDHICPAALKIAAHYAPGVSDKMHISHASHHEAIRYSHNGSDWPAHLGYRLQCNLRAVFRTTCTLPS
jgi:hypothetical protein